MFSGASNIKIEGGTFIAHGSSGTEESEKKRIRDAMVLLDSRAEKGAPYDAAAREDVPKCQEQTRVAVIDGIHKWAHDPNTRPLKWIYGPAGSGKTTIVQTVAETFDEEGSLAASFFFSRLSEGRPKTKDNFVITLAHQLSLHIPALQPLLADTLSDLSLLSKSLTKQLDELIIRPLNKLDIGQIGSRSIFLVDGLDECEGDAAQRDILHLLERLLDQIQHRISVIIASRSLSHIQAFLSQGSISAITQTTPLDDDYESNEDIAKFFMWHFQKILKEHPARSGLPAEWPSRSFIDNLVRRASGQFIYASVVMKFIANHGRHPDQSLKTIIELKVNDVARPYEELDAVYSHVLSTVEPENIEFVQTLMGCLLMDANHFFFAHVVQKSATLVIDEMFRTLPGTTNARINRMHPLIVPVTSGGMQFTHASFPDYLLDQSRSKEFFLDIAKVHCTLAQCWFELFAFHFQQNSRHTPGSAESYLTTPLFSHGPGWVIKVDDLFHEYDTILYQVFYHCQQAKWTPGLRQSLLTFDLNTAFRTQSDGTIRWHHVIAFVGIILWAKEHVPKSLLAPTDAEYLEHCIKPILTALPISDAQRKFTAAALTCYNTLEQLSEGIVFEGLEVDSNLMNCFYFGYIFFKDDIQLRKALLIWLCQALLPDIPMKGPFFSDANLYTDAALNFLHNALTIHNSLSRISGRVLLALISNAAPSEELATILTQNIIQFERKILDSQDRKGTSLFLDYNYLQGAKLSEQNLEAFFIPICIYLNECYGTAFITEHQHGPEYHPYTWVCGICMLCDAYKMPESLGFELSKVPKAKLVAYPPQIEGEIHELHPINPPPYIILALPLFWLRIWIVWLADVIVRFFPVVA